MVQVLILPRKGDGLVPGVERRLRIVGMDRFGPAIILILGGTLPGKCRPARLLADHPARRVIGPQHAFNRLDRRTKPVLFMFQQKQPPFSRNVPVRPDHPHRYAVRIVHHRRLGAQMADFAARRDDRKFGVESAGSGEGFLQQRVDAQKALDDPYLDKLMSIFTTQLLALREAMHKHWLADPKYRNLAVDKDHSTDYFRALGHDQAIDQVTAQIDDLIKEYQK